MEILDRKGLVEPAWDAPPPIKAVVETCRVLYATDVPLLYRKPEIISLNVLRKFNLVLSTSDRLSEAVQSLSVKCEADKSTVKDFHRISPEFPFATLPNCVCLSVNPGYGSQDDSEFRLHLYHILLWTTHCPSLETLCIHDFYSE